MILGEIVGIKTKFIDGIISKEEVIGLLKQKRITDLENTVIISISDPEFKESEQERAPIKYKYLNQFSSFLEIKFYDTIKEYYDEDGKLIYPIDKETVSIISDFIRSNKDKKFIINCNAGISRSAGVGLLVEYICGEFEDLYHFKTSFDDVISSHYRYEPNLAVLDNI